MAASLQLQHTAAPFSSSAFHSPKVAASLSSSSSLVSFPLRRLPRLRSTGGGARCMSGTAAASYAQALADLARSHNTLESTGADVEKLERIFAEPQVLDFFCNPTIDDHKKRAVVADLAASLSLQPTTANFLNILLDSKRIGIVADIVREFETVTNALTDTEVAVVTSVVPLESQHLAQIARQVQKLTGAKNVRIKTVIEPELVAGFTVRFGNTGSKLIDMSVKKQLEDIAAQLELGDITLASAT